MMQQLRNGVYDCDWQSDSHCFSEAVCNCYQVGNEMEYTAVCTQKVAELWFQSSCGNMCMHSTVIKFYLQACHSIDNNPNLFVLHHEFLICRKISSNCDPSQAQKQANDLERNVYIVPPGRTRASQTPKACNDNAGGDEPSPG